jgi:hypothetical protein
VPLALCWRCVGILLGTLVRPILMRQPVFRSRSASVLAEGTFKIA